jgi:hypothetical protein
LNQKNHNLQDQMPEFEAFWPKIVNQNHEKLEVDRDRNGDWGSRILPDQVVNHWYARTEQGAIG